MTPGSLPMLPDPTARPQPGGSIYPDGRRHRAVTVQDMAANVAVDAWARLLGLIADGVKSHDAIAAVGATRALVEGMLRGSKQHLEQWNNARQAALRRMWDIELVQDICTDIAAGLSATAACTKRQRDVTTFLKLVLADPVIREEYDTARRIRAELWADETIEIADDDANDMDITGRSNMAAVKRADTRIGARHKLMGDFARQRFGNEKTPQVEVNINLNHAERLEAAQARRKSLRREEPVTDAEIIPKSAPSGVPVHQGGIDTPSPPSSPAQELPAQELPDWLRE